MTLDVVLDNNPPMMVCTVYHPNHIIYIFPSYKLSLHDIKRFPSAKKLSNVQCSLLIDQTQMPKKKYLSVSFPSVDQLSNA